MEASITQDTGIVKTHSGFGVASLIIGTVTFVLMGILMAITALLETTTPGGVDPESVAAILIGLSLFSCLLLQLLAIALGVIAIMRKNGKKVFPILGIIFATVTLLITAVIMF